MENETKQNMENTTPTQETIKEEGSTVGPIIGIVIIIIVLLLGVLYFWGQRVSDTDQENVADIQATEAELSDIEAELSNEFSELEAELNAEF